MRIKRTEEKPMKIKKAPEQSIKVKKQSIKQITAASLGEAIDKVMEMYHDEEIVLDSGDFQEVTIEQERKERGR